MTSRISPTQLAVIDAVFLQYDTQTLSAEEALEQIRQHLFNKSPYDVLDDIHKRFVERTKQHDSSDPDDPLLIELVNTLRFFKLTPRIEKKFKERFTFLFEQIMHSHVQCFNTKHPFSSLVLPNTDQVLLQFVRNYQTAFADHIIVNMCSIRDCKWTILLLDRYLVLYRFFQTCCLSSPLDISHLSRENQYLWKQFSIDACPWSPSPSSIDCILVKSEHTSVSQVRELIQKKKQMPTKWSIVLAIQFHQPLSVIKYLISQSDLADSIVDSHELEAAILSKRLEVVRYLAELDGTKITFSPQQISYASYLEDKSLFEYMTSHSYHDRETHIDRVLSKQPSERSSICSSIPEEWWSQVFVETVDESSSIVGHVTGLNKKDMNMFVYDPVRGYPETIAYTDIEYLQYGTNCYSFGASTIGKTSKPVGTDIALIFEGPKLHEELPAFDWKDFCINPYPRAAFGTFTDSSSPFLSITMIGKAKSGKTRVTQEFCKRYNFLLDMSLIWCQERDKARYEQITKGFSTDYETKFNMQTINAYREQLIQYHYRVNIFDDVIQHLDVFHDPYFKDFIDQYSCRVYKYDRYITPHTVFIINTTPDKEIQHLPNTNTLFLFGSSDKSENQNVYNQYPVLAKKWKDFETFHRLMANLPMYSFIVMYKSSLTDQENEPKFYWSSNVVDSKCFEDVPSSPAVSSTINLGNEEQRITELCPDVYYASSDELKNRGLYVLSQSPPVPIPEMKYLVIGAPKCGKTSFIENIMSQHTLSTTYDYKNITQKSNSIYTDYQETKSVKEYTSRFNVSGFDPVKITLVDVPGRTLPLDIKHYIDPYLETPLDAIWILYDSTSSYRSMKEIMFWLEQIHQINRSLSLRIYLCYNKYNNLANEYPAEDASTDISFSMIKDFIRKNGYWVTILDRLNLSTCENLPTFNREILSSIVNKQREAINKLNFSNKPPSIF